jgi:hypothetical protein
MIGLGAVCLMACAVIMGLWWPREMRAVADGAGSGLRAQDKAGIVRQPPVTREPRVRSLDSILPEAV